MLLVDESLERQQQWDQACTAHGAAFYSAASRGTCTYFFANLHQHSFAPLVRVDHQALFSQTPPDSSSLNIKRTSSQCALSVPIHAMNCHYSSMQSLVLHQSGDETLLYQNDPNFFLVMFRDSIQLDLQEKAGADPADTPVLEQQQLQFPSLESALKVDWSGLHPRRSHKLICLLTGEVWLVWFVCGVCTRSVAAYQCYPSPS